MVRIGNYALSFLIDGMHSASEMSKAERLLSYAILSMITSRPLASAPTTGIGISEEEEQEDPDRKKGHMNSDGAWCWREDCEGAHGNVAA